MGRSLSKKEATCFTMTAKAKPLKMNESNLLVITLTKSVKEKIHKANLASDIEEELLNLDQIRLFNYRTKHDLDNNEEGRVALPFSKGKNVFMLKPASEGNYYVAIDIWFDANTNWKAPNHYALPITITCQLLDYGSQYKNYDFEALELEVLHQNVIKLAPWRPHESSNFEETKWEQYFDLYKQLIDKKKVKFTLTDIIIRSNILRARVPDDAWSESDQWRNEVVSYNKNRIGSVKSINNKFIEIKLNNEFSIKFNGPKHTQLVKINDSDFEIQHSNLIAQIQDNQIHFTFENLEYTAYGSISESQSDNNKVSNLLNIDSTSIALVSLPCAIDFFSEEYQLKVMKQSFSTTKRMDIWEVLSGDRPSKLPKDVDIRLDDTMYNEQQKNAIRGAVGATELFLIWGPPGTGKTHVIKEISKQEVLRGRKVLITSQTNTAVDNALARLFDDKHSYPFRIAKNNYKLEGEDVQKIPFWNSSPRFYLTFLQSNIKNSLACDNNKKIRQQFLTDIDKSLKILLKKEKSETELREFTQLAELYKRKINVVGSTLMESGKTSNIGSRGAPLWINNLQHTTGIDQFDTIIVDEVSKATPPELFIPVPLGKKLILVGDHKQLPPMFKVLSGDTETLEDMAKEIGMNLNDLDPDNTIFERLWKRHTGDNFKCRAMLTQQYRMHSKIETLIKPFYDEDEGTIFSSPNNEDVFDMNIDHPLFSDKPFLWIGTKKDSKEVREGTSFYNEDEIIKTGKLLQKLADVKDKNMSIGVITFYGAQLRRLIQNYKHFSNKFNDGKLIFGTVDRFQGRECDVIICSFVRNHDRSRREIGFAAKTHRINVALSRARKALVILGRKELFAYETHSKNEKGQKAVDVYKYIYDQRCSFKPKHLDNDF